MRFAVVMGPILGGLAPACALTEQEVLEEFVGRIGDAAAVSDAERGVQTLRLDLSKAKLDVGPHTLVAFDKAPDQRIEAAFRVVESPWEDPK